MQKSPGCTCEMLLCRTQIMKKQKGLGIMKTALFVIYLVTYYVVFKKETFSVMFYTHIFLQIMCLTISAYVSLKHKYAVATKILYMLLTAALFVIANSEKIPGAHQ